MNISENPYNRGMNDWAQWALNLFKGNYPDNPYEFSSKNYREWNLAFNDCESYYYATDK